MADITKDQERQLWERCGIKFDWHPRVTRHAYKTLDGEWHFGKPSITLDNLFKRAVPKLREDYDGWLDLLHDWINGLYINYSPNDDNGTSAQALALAILQRKEKEEEGNETGKD